MQRRRSLLIISGVILALVIVFFVSGKINAPEPTGSNTSFKDGDLVSLSGELQCLPHRDQSGPQTLECAYGFKDESGNYYALEDTTQDYSLIGNTPMNEPVQVEGTYRPNSDTKYQQNGTIQVTAITK